MSIIVKKILLDCLNNKNLLYKDVKILFNKILNKKISLILITAIIIALKFKGESIDEITAAAKVIRKFSVKIPLKIKIDNFLDIVGTGGDMYNTFNISTASMFIVAAAGINVAKHGGRFVSSITGSADVLERLGVNINLDSIYLSDCILKTCMAFMLSSNYYICMKDIFFLRKEIGIKTIFNIIAPLINPINVKNIFMGVFNKNLVKIQIRVLKRLGIKRAIVVCGDDGLDEVTLGGYTNVSELKNNKILEYKIHPRDFNFNVFPSIYLKVFNIEESKKIILNIFYGENSPFSDIVILNSGVALYTSGIVSSIKEGILKSREIINSGLALEKLNQFIYVTNNF